MARVNALARVVARRRFRFIAAVVTLTAASAALAVAGARGDGSFRAIHGSGDLTGVILVCSTDTVTLSGSYRFTETGFVKQLSDGTFFSRGSLAFDLSGMRGTGASGVAYRVVGATNEGFAFTFGPSAPGTDVEHTTVMWHLVPIGGGTPLSFAEIFAFVVTPSGSTTLVDHGSGSCI